MAGYAPPPVDLLGKLSSMLLLVNRHGALNGTVHFPVSGSIAAGGGMTQVQASVPVPFACVARNLRVVNNVVMGAGTGCVWTIAKPAGLTALTCSHLANDPAETTRSDLVNEVSFAANEQIALRAVTVAAQDISSRMSLEIYKVP